jgi:hydroxymethylpyrimidine pyrophosphatase-like HAD family hydrolase
MLSNGTVGVDKGVALGLLCDHLHIPIEKTVAFGDGENDKEFLAAAGVGCAMKNARPAAKSAANIVIDVSPLLLLSCLVT